MVARRASTARASRSKRCSSGGHYRYRSGALDNAWVTGTEEEVQLLPGWRFKRDRLELKVFAGLDIKNDVTSPYDPSNRLHGTSVGARAAVNLWFEPTPVDHDRRRRLAVARSPPAIRRAPPMAGGCSDWFYLGPEAQTFACIGYSQLRFGVHLTGLKTDAMGMVGGGRLVQRQRPSLQPLSAPRRIDAAVD